MSTWLDVFKNIWLMGTLPRFPGNKSLEKTRVLMIMACIRRFGNNQDCISSSAACLVKEVNFVSSDTVLIL
jgi:hypothetical protein